MVKEYPSKNHEDEELENTTSPKSITSHRSSYESELSNDSIDTTSTGCSPDSTLPGSPSSTAETFSSDTSKDVLPKHADPVMFSVTSGPVAQYSPILSFTNSPSISSSN